MEPITAIVTAITAGAAAGLNSSAKQAVADLYSGLKTIIQNKYSEAYPSLIALENKPESENKAKSLGEDLEETNAANDLELIDQTQSLLRFIEAEYPQLPQAIGIKLETIKAANIRLGEITIEAQQAAGVHIKDAEITNDIVIDKVSVRATTAKK